MLWQNLQEQIVLLLLHLGERPVGQKDRNNQEKGNEGHATLISAEAQSHRDGQEQITQLFRLFNCRTKTYNR